MFTLKYVIMVFVVPGNFKEIRGTISYTESVRPSVCRAVLANAVYGVNLPPKPPLGGKMPLGGIGTNKNPIGIIHIP